MLSSERLLRVLAHPMRREILWRLTSGERNSVSDLQELLHKRQSYVSQQLAVLRGAGLVACQREGHACYYTLAGDATSSTLRAILRLIYALPARERSCSFLIAGESLPTLQVIHMATKEIPCRLVDVITYEPGQTPDDVVGVQPIVLFGLRPSTVQSHRGVRHCPHREKLLEAMRQCGQIIQDCQMCGGGANRRHRTHATLFKSTSSVSREPVERS